jgi:hypothetical protein
MFHLLRLAEIENPQPKRGAKWDSPFQELSLSRGLRLGYGIEALCHRWPERLHLITLRRTRKPEQYMTTDANTVHEVTEKAVWL